MDGEDFFVLFGLIVKKIASFTVLTYEIYVIFILLNTVKFHNIRAFDAHHAVLLTLDVLFHEGILIDNFLGDHLEGKFFPILKILYEKNISIGPFAQSPLIFVSLHNDTHDFSNFILFLLDILCVIDTKSILSIWII